MNGKKIQWTLGAIAGICACMSVTLYWLELASATPAYQFNSEILSRAYFDEIVVGIRRGFPHKRTFDMPHGGGDLNDRLGVKILAPEPSDVYVVRNTVPPGGYSGWHTHPGPSVVSIKSGTATVYEGDDPSCAPKTYPAGTGFIDEGGEHVHMVRNEGTVDLVTVAFQIVPTGAERRQDAPSPGVCGF